jgi:hypothetical protein
MKKLFILFTVVFSNLGLAATWKLENCKGELSKFGPQNRAQNQRGTYLFSLVLNDQTGLGRGQVQIKHQVRGENSTQRTIPLNCSFLKETKYGVIVNNPNLKEFILCESEQVVVANQKFGIPFFLSRSGFPGNFSSYVQLENGNDGAGAVFNESCKNVQKLN